MKFFPIFLKTLLSGVEDSLFERGPSWRKEIRDFASRLGLALMVTPPSRSILGTEQKSLLWQGQILIKWLLEIKPSAWFDTRQPCRPQQIGTQSTHGGIWMYTLALLVE